LGGEGLSGLLSAFGGENSLDPALLLKAGKALSAMNSTPDERCALLTALRPYLRHERQERVDEAIKILRLIRLAELFRG